MIMIASKPSPQKQSGIGSSTEAPGVFPNAHDFVINHLSVGGDRLDDAKSLLLKELGRHSIPGAEFNSAERDPPPRCHPGTRTAIREQFHAHINAKDYSRQTRIMWMHGPAGVGKSAIMQTIAEEMVSQVVCSTLFFSRPNHRDDARKTFPTLAYSLAVAVPAYREYIGMIMRNDPMCLTKSLDEQFKSLFVTPFTENHVETGSQQWIMLLDGLDECQNTRDSDNQCRILNLISKSVSFYAESTPFIWVIASRHEDNLKKAWLEVQEQFEGRASELWELAIPVDSDQATRDVELYLHKSFESIRKRYSELMPTHPRWPSDSDFLKIAKKSSGLFIFASTVIRYVSDDDPVLRLKFIIFSIDRIEQVLIAADEKPFQLIDLLYSSIMSDVPRRLLPVVKTLIGLYHVSGVVHISKSSQEVGERMNFVEACNILVLQQNEAYTALRKLQSVLSCPAPGAAQENGILFFHTSFSDYLLDRSRSQVYFVDLDRELTTVWGSYTTILKQSTSAQGHSGISTSWLPNNDPSLLDGLQQDLLSRAQKNWIGILITCVGFQTPSRSLLVDTPELLGAFESLGLAFMGGKEFPIEGFLDWLNNYAPSGVKARIVPQTFFLGQLDMECLFKSLCATPQYRRSITSYVRDIDLTTELRDLGVSQWAAAKAALWSPWGMLHRLVEAYNGKERVPVTVVGVEASKTCAIVGPLFTKATHEGEKRYYIFPYSQT